MSDFGPAIAFTRQEEGGYADDDTRAPAPPTGEVVNRGLTHWFLRSVGYLAPLPRNIPATPQEKLLIKNMSLDTTEKLYQEYFWNAYRCGEIASQPVAGKYFDLSVNDGPGEACLILQRAVNEALPRTTIATDGIIGQATIAAANECDPMTLLSCIREQGEKYYNEIPDPDNTKAAWIARLNRG